MGGRFMFSTAGRIGTVVGLAALILVLLFVFREDVPPEQLGTGTDGTETNAGPITAKPKTIDEQTRDEIQSQLVGTWQANDGTERVFSFDKKWRVTFVGKGLGPQEVDPELVEGRVKYDIEASPDPPTLSIVHPQTAEGISGQYRVKRLTDEEMDLVRIEDGQQTDLVTFVRTDPKPFSWIEEEEKGGGGAN